jgi:hypothetical protein
LPSAASTSACRRWNRDPESGVLGPSIYAGDIAITNRELVGDIKHVWELNRHLHLVRLAQAWAATNDAAWLHALHQQLRSWLDQCPPLVGPNWTSSLELGIRLINWAWCGSWSAAKQQPVRRRGGRAPARRLARFDPRPLQRDRAAFVAPFLGQQPPDRRTRRPVRGRLDLAVLEASGAWLEQARRELEHEAQAQFSRDGVNREQAFAYHIFSSEFLFVAGLVGQACGHSVLARLLDQPAARAALPALGARRRRQRADGGRRRRRHRVPPGCARQRPRGPAAGPGRRRAAAAGAGI